MSNPEAPVSTGDFEPAPLWREAMDKAAGEFVTALDLLAQGEGSDAMHTAQRGFILGGYLVSPDISLQASVLIKELNKLGKVVPKEHEASFKRSYTLNVSDKRRLFGLTCIPGMNGELEAIGLRLESGDFPDTNMINPALKDAIARAILDDTIHYSDFPIQPVYEETTLKQSA